MRVGRQGTAGRGGGGERPSRPHWFVAAVTVALASRMKGAYLENKFCSNLFCIFFKKVKIKKFGSSRAAVAGTHVSPTGPCNFLVSGWARPLIRKTKIR
jgi:hypothetical protein